jgi:uncharacterized protein with ParB-like and HNH nuclease domain
MLLKDVTEATFNEIITPSRIQFVIPIWQRTYSWERQQWRDLWEDLMELYEKLAKGESAQHFLGPIVLKTYEQKVGRITRWVIIDGQQRLTTLLVICALIRDKAKSDGNDDLVKEIEGHLLFNEFAKELEDKPKLSPTEADRKLFDLIMVGQPLNGLETNNQLHLAYEYFKTVFEFEFEKNKITLDALLDCITALKMVTIRLEESDNPNRIFETLNFRGKELSQSDLVRNFFMMSIREPSVANEVYLQVWFPMQQALGTNTLERIKHLESFLKHYVVMKSQVVIKEDKIYSRIRRPLKNSNQDQVISELRTISGYSKSYEKLLYPLREPNPNIQQGIERLNRLKLGVQYPFLLKIYTAFSTGKISQEDFVSILKILESYIVRRMFSRLPTHSLNRLFAELCSIDDSKIPQTLREKLATKKEWETQYWPSDVEFKQHFLTLPIYKISAEKCRFILESLEEHFNHPEPVKFSNLWIEHVMPETLDSSWQKYLGEKWKNIHEGYLHTIGNLTLIAEGPNESIKNKLFQDKKTGWYKFSNISLTKEINNTWTEWKEAEIQQRGNTLADRAIKIWPRPNAGEWF